MECSVQLVSRVQLFTTPWTAAHQASLPFTISQSLLKLMSVEFDHMQNIITKLILRIRHYPAPGLSLKFPEVTPGPSWVSADHRPAGSRGPHMLCLRRPALPAEAGTLPPTLPSSNTHTEQGLRHHWVSASTAKLWGPASGPTKP